MNSEKKARILKQLLLKQYLGPWSVHLYSLVEGKEDKV